MLYWNVVMQVILRTAEIDMADSVNPVSLMSFYQTKHIAFHSTYHTVLKSLTRYSNNWTRHARRYSVHSWLEKIGEHKQPTDCNPDCENESRIDYDNKVVTKYSYGTMVFLRKAKSRYLREPWLTTSVKTNGTIRVQCGNKSKMINIQRVKPFNDVTNI
jgi:hypothetical protein